MSVTLMAMVFRHSKSQGTARLVLLALADEASDEGMVTAYRRSQSHLARKANCSVEAVRRAIRKLTELGEVAVLAAGSGHEQTNYRITVRPPKTAGGPHNLRGPQPEGAAPTPTPPQPPRGRTPRPHAGEGANIPVSPSLPGVPGPAEPKASEPKQPPAGDELTRRVWDALDPKPAQPFVAVRKIIAAMLAAGWSDDDVFAAAVAAPTISTRALEVQLNQRRRRVPAGAPIDTDRGGPTGEVGDQW